MVVAEAGTDAAFGGGRAYRDVVLADRPVAYFEFDEEPDANGNILDSKSNAHTGNVVGTPIFGAQPLVNKGHAWTFMDGAYVELGQAYDFSGQAPFTIEVWVAADLTADFMHIFTSQFRDAPKHGYALTVRQGTLGGERFVANLGAKSEPVDEVPLPQIAYVALVYDGTSLLTYINAAQAGIVADARPLESSAVHAVIASESSRDNFYPLRGSLDELAIYPTALTIQQLQTHYAAGGGQ